MTTSGPTTGHAVRTSAPQAPTKPKMSDELAMFKAFVRICSLNRQDVQILHDMEYKSVKDMAIFGIFKNVQSLLSAGLADAKAHKIVLFGTYVAHNRGTISGASLYHLTFEDLVDFNVCLQSTGPESSSNNAFHQHHSVSHQRQQPAAPPVFHTPEPQRQVSAPPLPVSPQQPSATATATAKAPQEGLAKVKSMRRLCSHNSMEDGSSSRWSSNSKFTTRSSPGRLASMPINVVGKREVSPNQQQQQLQRHSHHLRTTKQASSSFRNTIKSPEGGKKSGTYKHHQHEQHNHASDCQSKSSALQEEKRISTGSDKSSNCIRPQRKPSLGPGEDTWKHASSLMEEQEQFISNMPPSCPAKRSTMRWAVALDHVSVDEDLTDSESETSEESDDENSDSDSDYDSDDSDDDESDFDSDDDDEDEDEGSTSSDSETSVHWGEANVNPHEWTLPMNTVLPVNMQELFREAAKDGSVDINQRLQEALKAGRLQCTYEPNPATA